MTPRRLGITLACVSLLALPASAVAAHKLVPPGNSGASQYFESVPSASGNTPPPQLAPHPSSSPGEVALGKLGKQGQAAAALAAAGAPSPARGAGRRLTPPTHGGRPRPTSTRHGAQPGPGSGTRIAIPSGNGAIDSIARALGAPGSGGLGVILPILLAGALAAAVGLAVGRRMRRDDA